MTVASHGQLSHIVRHYRMSWRLRFKRFHGNFLQVFFSSYYKHYPGTGTSVESVDTVDSVESVDCGVTLWTLELPYRFTVPRTG